MRQLNFETLETRRVLDASAPAMLQWFETDYEVMETRLSDVFEAGYGSIRREFLRGAVLFSAGAKLYIGGK